MIIIIHYCTGCNIVERERKIERKREQLILLFYRIMKYIIKKIVR